MKKIGLIIIVIFVYQTINATSNIHFIRLNTQRQSIELGDYTYLLFEDSKYTITRDKLNNATIFTDFFTERVQGSVNDEVLFFIHCMWGSNKLFVKYQLNDFNDSYIKDERNPIKH